MPTRPEEIFPLRPPLTLPDGVEEKQLHDWLKNVQVAGCSAEIKDYFAQDFRRFIYTYGLVKSASSDIAASKKKCLELGANPYFVTILLKKFTPCELTLANYFGSHLSVGLHSQKVGLSEFNLENQSESKSFSIALDYHHFNVEEDSFPFDDASFDIVLFCEIIEHLLMDPLKVLFEIKRVLKPDGQLILTTPNVNRLENVARMLSGTNIYDPYSAYGPYGRHNREYNKHELYLLLNHAGFFIREMFSADVHENITSNFFDLSKFQDLLNFRRADLGQYIFLRAAINKVGKDKKPTWLYRSYSADKMDE